MQSEVDQRPCERCPTRTPFRADSETIQRAHEMCSELPLDPGIRPIVELLIAAGVETFESCEGGDGHSFPEPTVRFEGELSEGLRALSVAIAHGMRVRQLRRVWAVRDGMAHGPWWELVFSPPQPDAPMRRKSRKA